eukprot:m.86806 g.86806  ORF g.86806 m.86806 type:complete len:82 (-) comp14767_c0_seq96:355-600(-)
MPSPPLAPPVVAGHASSFLTFTGTKLAKRRQGQDWAEEYQFQMVAIIAAELLSAILETEHAILGILSHKFFSLITRILTFF